MIREADAWVGRTLFVPLIIRICQMANITQGTFHNYGWMLAGMTMLAAVTQWSLWSILIVVAVAIWVLIAALDLPPHGEGQLWFRVMLVCFMLINVLGVIAGTDPWFRPVADLIGLAAEYARTIKTIPPKETKEKAGRLAKQSA